MVIYDLSCRKGHRFEGWFPSYDAYQEQASRGLIACPTCGSKKVQKLPHACAVLSQRKEPEREPAPSRARPPSEAEVREMLFRLHHYVKENFEDVGPRFAQEARAIFYGKGAKRNIHGTATPEERQALDEEGIPYWALPKPKTDA
jgi:hypothetical protein